MLFNPWPEVLKLARTERGLSQENAAARAGVSTITWYRWEKGLIHPGHKVLDNLARGVDLTPDALGLRYSQALLAHYQERLAEFREPGELADGAGAAASLAAAAADDPRRRPAPVMVRAFSSELGLVYVEAGELLDRVAEHRAAGAAEALPDESRSRPRVKPFRRNGR